MNLYTSDLHLGHANVIRHDQRPFADVTEMDRTILQLWNNRVQQDDHVYIVGDFTYKSKTPAEEYLRKMRGHKHLIVGNHDRELLHNDAAMSCFDSVDHMLFLQDEYRREIVLCHYPLAEWNKSRHGSWLVYGHIHNNKDDVYEFMKTRKRALNAAVCINNYMPVSLEELLRNNRFFQGEEYDEKEALY